jgi:hypothetical protein
MLFLLDQPDGSVISIDTGATYIINRADGGITLVDTDDPNMFFAKWQEQMKKSHSHWLPATIEPFDGDLPEDWTFRDAWVKKGRNVEVDLDKAKAVFGNVLMIAKRRKARDLMVREVAGEDVAAEKAALQDIKPDVSKVRSPDELKAMWPTSLQPA